MGSLVGLSGPLSQLVVDEYKDVILTFTVFAAVLYKSCVWYAWLFHNVQDVE
jgi:hypothetical protein